MGRARRFRPMDRARRALGKEPWHHVLSLALLVVMVDAYVIGGTTSGVFLVFILIAIGWFLLYGFVIFCGLLARADNAFWDWLAGRTM
jgi:hypothetical protein